jgi:hypothetical protein
VPIPLRASASGFLRVPNNCLNATRIRAADRLSPAGLDRRGTLTSASSWPICVETIDPDAECHLSGARAGQAGFAAVVRHRSRVHGDLHHGAQIRDALGSRPLHGCPSGCGQIPRPRAMHACPVAYRDVPGHEGLSRYDQRVTGPASGNWTLQHRNRKVAASSSGAGSCARRHGDARRRSGVASVLQRAGNADRHDRSRRSAWRHRARASGLLRTAPVIV